MTLQTIAKQLTRTTKYKLNNGQYIPVAGFGVYLLLPAETFELVYEALLQGYRHIDSAVIYGNQKEAAQAIAQFIKDHEDVSREDIWFTTKIWNSDQGYDGTKNAVAQIAAEVKEHIDYVDLVLVHSPLTSKEKRVGTWKALSELNHNPNNGVLQIRSIGVSNYGVEHIEEILAQEGPVVVPAVNQLELHPWLPRVALREYLTLKGIVIEAYSPLTQGQNLSDPELLHLEHKYKIPKAEILLKWSYLQGFVVLAKTSKKERIKQNFEVLPEGRGSSDALDEGSNLGKIDLDPNILDVLDKPDSKKVFTWHNSDPTEFKDSP
ncbi:Aldo/keto reductase [Metschnikowia bicuspidata var. bicuspidata NRRL YB-4993]|uniref:2-dehydropantolactone reductase n=1 Tax=Metschnikowia bicuspidata var. bicuspidata NRRL YB-4993 TaxID=869754 RepID=A0A1A0HAR8_9ASCO|nr:Aldo/keto reductase [Metschnikowia bicuspidata var. bicuspidata NRRL YB-4993]OBA21111.1 Aldo/keto reductase [Metschnikowia bicuspidata var. bicuspidata NRRL YB-4993]